MNDDTAEVHQLLHGYTDGHGQLGGSIQLSRVDTRTTLVLSDSSVSGARVHPGGYLTGYPLPDSGFYALARTWLATELPRPGCVWTHTLLVDFADLANLKSLSGLLALFLRPTSFDFAAYRTGLRYTDSEPKGRLNGMELERSGLWLSTLYGSPSMSVTAFREERLNVDGMAAAIWEQQWPKLRRSFRFCTFTVTDRSMDGAQFDLQLLPEQASFIKTRFRASVEAGTQAEPSDVWVNEAIQDLRSPDVDGLRSFLRKVGSEIGLGRSNFRTLCLIRAVLESVRRQPSEVNEALGLLIRELTASEMGALQGLVATMTAENAEYLDRTYFLWLFSHIEAVGEESFLRALPLLSQRAFQTVLDTDVQASVSQFFLGKTSDRQRRIVDEIEPNLLISRVLMSSFDGQRALLMLRPDLLKLPNLWSAVTKLHDGIWTVAESLPESDELLQTLISVHNDELATTAMVYFGVTRCLRALTSACTNSTSSLEERRRWLIACLQKPGAVAQAFNDEANWERKLLVEISRLIAPEAIPNEVGVDPWLGAYARSTGRIPENDQLFISCYLLNRALSGASQSAHQLVCQTLQFVYKKAAENSLTEEAWRVLEYRLPWSYFWYDWDRCRRLRDAVAELYMKQGIPAGAFFEIANDLSIFDQLVRGIRERKKGRRYLERMLIEAADISTRLLDEKIAVVRQHL